MQSRRGWMGEPLSAITVGGGGEEDRFTHGLAALLQDPELAAGFLQELCATPSVDQVRVTTQRRVIGGRVDLRLEGDSVYVIIEVKVGADLHGLQISAYAHDVALHAGGRLFLLTPSAAQQRLTEEARRQIPPAVDRVSVDSFSWKEVADFFHRRARSAEPRLSVYLTDFADLVTSYVETYRRPFTASELDLLGRQDVADLMERTEVLLALAFPALKLRYPASPRGAIRGGLGFNGAWLTVGDGHSIWFGINVTMWRLHGYGPFWVNYQSGAPHHWEAIALQHGFPPAFHRPKVDEIMVPVVLDAAPSLEECAAALAERAGATMDAMARALALSGFPPVPAPTSTLVPEVSDAL